jgi:hypothetical protein
LFIESVRVFLFVGGLIVIHFVSGRGGERERVVVVSVCVVKGNKEEFGGSQCHILLIGI